MELIRGFHNLRPDRHRGTVLTIGNFDGVHLGHQAILERLTGLAHGHGHRASVLLFEPTPREYFAPQSAPARLMTLAEKLPVLAALGVDRVVCLRFDRRIADMSPKDFVLRLLVRGLGVSHVLVGRDVRFGRQRTGTLETLMALGCRYGFEVLPVETVMRDGERVSSTRIRACLAAGDFAQARRLLGRPYTMTGRVGHGEKLGRTLGYPTVNIPVRRHRSPLRGVFAVRVHGVDPGGDGGEGGWPGVASLGTRPTVDGEGLLLEVYLFDFTGDLYGRRLAVEFVAWLRDEERFDSLDALIRQMDADAAQARARLAAPSRSSLHGAGATSSSGEL